MEAGGFWPKGGTSRRYLAALVGVALACSFATTANAAWHQPVGGASPLNVSAAQDADNPSIASVGGVPYVAWAEYDGSNTEIRVARLNAAGTAWEKVADAASPINQDATENASGPAIADIGGVPYVSWAEDDGANVQQLRVARLNATGTAWEKVGQALNPASPLNFSATAQADSDGPSLIGINGVPYVAWIELNGNWEVRVAKLNAAGTGWDKLGTPAASPINKDTSQDATQPSLTSIDGVPWVAWAETDGTFYQVRVARYNAAANVWERVADGASPINEAANQSGSRVSITNVGGVPYVAWRESDGTNLEIRVARLNATGTAWEKVADSASPINESSITNATNPSLTAISSTPYVAWEENDGTNKEIRVARLNAAGTAWEKPADSASPINQSSGRDGLEVSLVGVGGVPYVAWDETDGTAYQARVSRLEPEFVGQSVVPGATGATFTAQWHTYGVEFPLGFEYGASLESSTAPTLAPVGVDSPTISQQVSGLSPASPYQFRAFATAGVPQPRLLAPSATVFNTAAAPDTKPPQTTITKEPKNKLDASKAKYKFTSSEPNSTFVCKFDKAKPKPCDAGKAKYKHLDNGKHKFSVIATDAAGNADESAAKDKFKVL